MPEFKGEKLGSAFVEIKADDTAFLKGIDKAETGFKTFDKNAQQFAKRLGVAFVAAGGAIGAALGASVVQATKFGDELDKMSKRTGITVETLSELQYAAQISGSNLDTVEKSLRFLARAMDDTARGVGESKDKFEKFGISVVDTDGNLRDVVSVMGDAADKIANMSSETEQVAVATDLFGSRMGTQLLPMLKEGSKGIEELRSRARDLGLVFSTQAAAAAAEFNDRVTEFRSSLKMASVQIGSSLIPILQTATVRLTDLIAQFNALDPSIKKTVGVGAAASAGFATLSGGALILISQLPKLIAGFGAFKAAMVAIPWGPIAVGAAGVGTALWVLKRNMDALKDSTTGLRGQIEGIKKASGGFSDAADMIKKALDNARDRGIDPTKASLADLGIKTEELTDTLYGQIGFWDKLTQKITGAGDEVKLVITPTRNAAALLSVLETTAAGSGAQIEYLEGEISKLASTADAANEKLGPLGPTIAELGKAVAPQTWEEITKKADAYFGITGEGYKSNALQANEFYTNILKDGKVTADAQIGLNNLIADNFTDWMAEAAWLESTHTTAVKQEIEKRGIVDQEWMDKRAKWREDYTQKVLKIQGDQVVAEGNIQDQLNALYQKGQDDIARMLKANEAGIAEATANILAESEENVDKHNAAVLKDVSDLTALYLNEVQRRYEREENFIQRFRIIELNSYEERRSALQQSFEEIQELYLKHGLDTTELERWRVEQLRAIRAMEWKQYSYDVADGIAHVANAYVGLWEIFHDTDMAEENMVKKSIVRLSQWVDKVSNTINSLVETWKNASTILAKIAQLFGGGGGGGQAQIAGQALQMAGAAGTGGGVIPGVATAGGAAAGGAGFFGRIGGAFKSAGGAIGGLPWGAIGGAAVTAGSLAGIGAIGYKIGKTIADSFREERAFVSRDTTPGWSGAVGPQQAEEWNKYADALNNANRAIKGQWRDLSELHAAALPSILALSQYERVPTQPRVRTLGAEGAMERYERQMFNLGQETIPHLTNIQNEVRLLREEMQQVRAGMSNVDPTLLYQAVSAFMRQNGMI